MEEYLENERKGRKSGKNRKKKNMDILWIILMSVCVIVMLVCVVILGDYYYKRYKAEREYEKLREANKKTEETKKPEEPSVDSEEPVVIPIDFETLWESNEDIYAWIEVPGTAINYPVLQHVVDDAYYLEHNLDHSEGRPGVIYSERSSAKDFSGFMNILYGHNMRNGTMFHDLHNYEEDGYLKEHDLIYIYTPEHIYTYQVFAAVVESDEHLLSRYDFTRVEDRQNYLDAIYGNSDSRNQYREGERVTAEERMLVLSTCVSGERENRYLVNAVLIDTK